MTVYIFAIEQGISKATVWYLVLLVSVCVVNCIDEMQIAKFLTNWVIWNITSLQILYKMWSRIKSTDAEVKFS